MRNFFNSCAGSNNNGAIVGGGSFQYTDSIVFSIRGQSNALGRADALLLPQLDASIQQNIYIFESPNIVEPYQAGNFSINTDQYGVELFLAQKLRDYHNKPVYIDKYAIGGTILANAANINGNWNLSGGETQLWAKGKTIHTSAEFYKKIQLLQGSSKFLLWFQGESDSEDQTFANAYLQNQKNIFNDWRTLVNNTAFPIIDVLTSNIYAYSSIVRAAKAQCAIDLPNITTIEGVGYSLQDTVHFNQQGFRDLAEDIFQIVKDYWDFN